MRVTQPRFRRLLGKVFHGLASVWVVGPVPDTQCGFKGFRREAAQDLFAGSASPASSSTSRSSISPATVGMAGLVPDPLARQARLAHARPSPAGGPCRLGPLPHPVPPSAGPPPGGRRRMTLEAGDRPVKLALAALPIVAIVSFVLGVSAALASAGDTLGFDFLAYHRAVTRVLDGLPLYDMSYVTSGGSGSSTTRRRSPCSSRRWRCCRRRPPPGCGSRSRSPCSWPGSRSCPSRATSGGGPCCSRAGRSRSSTRSSSVRSGRSVHAVRDRLALDRFTRRGRCQRRARCRDQDPAGPDLRLGPADPALPRGPSMAR